MAETILQLLDAAVAQHGTRPALVIKPGFRTRTWTYAELGALVPRVATVLRGAGVEPGERILLWAVNRPEWGIAFLGALWAGAVPVPIDVRSTEEFAASIAAQTQPKLVLASQPTLKPASRLELPALTVESLADVAQAAAPAPRAEIGPDTLAEIVFTSGSTGDPKGVMLTHRNIASNASSLRSVVPLGRETRLLSILPLSHMYGLNPGLLAPLIAGARVVYPTSLQPPVLARTFRENRATMLLAVPQVVKLLTNAVERRVDAAGRRRAFERLHAIARHLPVALRRLLFRRVLAGFGGGIRYLAVGGAAMNPVVAQRWLEMGVTSLQGYGATETSPVVAFTRIERNVVGTVGQVIPGVEVRIAPDGEVLVRGPSVFQGYWQRPEASAEVLRDGWYHTGDHGTLDAEGMLTLHGRKKEMLVLSDGTKVFPQDVERALVADPRVRDAVVLGVERPGGDVQVHAVLLLAQEADAADVVRQVNTRLAGHQQVRGFTVWDEEDFPRTPKLAVRKPAILQAIQGRREAAPEPQAAQDAGRQLTPVERLVAQLDGVPAGAIRAEARLSSDLGIDSLGRVELLSLVEEELGVYIDDGDLEPEATLADVERLVAASSGEPPPQGIFGWPLNPLVGALRIGIQQLLMLPAITLWYRRRTVGLEHLRDLRGPVVFAANHHLHNDNFLILGAIPVGWRWKLSVAAAADDIFGNRLRGFVAALGGNAFPMAREGGVRRSLDLLGARLDRGFSVLIYPEGKLTVGGPMQPFKSGTGLVAIHGAIPVVPMRLKVIQPAVLDAGTARRGWRGEVEVIFGTPLRFGIDADPNQATAEIQAAVEGLG
ncbi:MAG: AMP-binding protein [Candidatus Limnocylindria bacterium]